MTLPVLELGIDLYGSDLSEAMLDRCGKKAAARAYSVHLQCSDFREISKHFTRRFDCVASTGNSLAYVKNEEVIAVLHQMDSLVVPGGYLYSGLRNWDKIRRTKQRFIPITRLFTEIPGSTWCRFGIIIRTAPLISIYCSLLKKKTASYRKSTLLSITIPYLSSRCWKSCAAWGIRI